MVQKRTHSTLSSNVFPPLFSILTAITVVIIGGGPAGLETALTLYKNCLDTSCFVLDDADPSSFKVMGFKVISQSYLSLKSPFLNLYHFQVGADR